MREYSGRIDSVRLMSAQVPSSRASRSQGRFQIEAERLGPLPLVNHFLDRLGLEPLLEGHVPTSDRRTGLSSAKALGVLLRSIIVEREPIYRQQETVRGFGPGMYGLNAGQMERLNDDQIGRALDRLFDADRAALLTEAVLAAARAFELSFQELHNDSTTVRFSGQYRPARGDGLHRWPWRPLPHGAAAQSARGPRIPPLDPGAPTGLGTGVGSAQSAPAPRPAGSLVGVAPPVCPIPGSDPKLHDLRATLNNCKTVKLTGTDHSSASQS